MISTIALAASGSSAGLRICQSRAKVDLLITDVGQSGGMNGRQVADAARLVNPNLKVLFITGYAAYALVTVNGQEDAFRGGTARAENG